MPELKTLRQYLRSSLERVARQWRKYDEAVDRAEEANQHKRPGQPLEYVQYPGAMLFGATSSHAAALLEYALALEARLGIDRDADSLTALVEADRQAFEAERMAITATKDGC